MTPQLHGDGKYAPEELPLFVAQAADHPDVLLGSRMLLRRNAIQGDIPGIVLSCSRFIHVSGHESGELSAQRIC